MTSPTSRVIANLVWQAKWKIGLLVVSYVPIAAVALYGFVHRGPSSWNSLWPILEIATAWVVFRMTGDNAAVRILKASPLDAEQRGRIFWWLSAGTLIFVVHGVLNPLAVFVSQSMQGKHVSSLTAAIRNWTVDSFASIACLCIAFFITRWVGARIVALHRRIAPTAKRPYGMILFFNLVGGGSLVALFASYAADLYALQSLRYAIALLGISAVLALYFRPRSLARHVEMLSKISGDRIDPETAARIEEMSIRIGLGKFKQLPSDVLGWKIPLRIIVRAVYQSTFAVIVTCVVVALVSKDGTMFYAIGPIIIAVAGLPLICDYACSWRTLRVLPISVDRLALTVLSLFALPLAAGVTAATIAQAIEPYKTSPWQAITLLGMQFLSVPIAMRFAHLRKSIVLWTTVPMIACVAFISALPLLIDIRIDLLIFVAEFVIAFLATRRFLRNGQFQGSTATMANHV